MGMLKFLSITAAACVAAVSAQAATFSFEFAYPGPGIAEIPNSVELTTNSFVTAAITVPVPTTLAIYRLEQGDPLLTGVALGAPDGNVDLLLGSGRFDLVEQAFDFTGQLVGTVPFSGSFFHSLGLVYFDPVAASDVPFYYADLPFQFFVDDTATYGGIPFGSQTGTSDVIWVRLPGQDGLYRIEAAAGVPEPAGWALLIFGLGMTGVAVRRRAGAEPTPA